jgi:hypothetical protein
LSALDPVTLREHEPDHRIFGDTARRTAQRFDLEHGLGVERRVLYLGRHAWARVACHGRDASLLRAEFHD